MNPPKNRFHGINFREFYYSAILYRIIYNFANFILRISINREKSESYWPRKFPAIRYNNAVYH